MSLCTFSNEYLIKGSTMVDNIFISDYLPKATGDQVRVYLYGLLMCNVTEGKDNNIQSFAEELNMEIDDVYKAFTFWKELGLVEIVSKNPLEVRYIPILSAKAEPKKYKASKYSEFNKELQEMFPERMITPTEYNTYYDLIETQKIDIAAMLLIAKYCISIKGANVKYPYIITVARDWAKNGITTVKSVTETIEEHEKLTEEVKAVLAALGKKSPPDFEDKQLYIKWTKNWGYNSEAIILTAKSFKNRGSMEKLDKVLDEYYRMGLFTSQEITDFMKERNKMYDIAKTVNKNLGLYYESLDYIVESYISKWLELGFDEKALFTISVYCFKTSIRTLEGMNNAIHKFYGLGLLTTEAINSHINKLAERDKVISEIISLSGSLRNITQTDRDYFNTWHNEWGHSIDLIKYVAKAVSGQSHSFRQMNLYLAKFKDEKIFTLEKAQNSNILNSEITTDGKKKDSKNYIKHEYTKEELESFFYDIDKLSEE